MIETPVTEIRTGDTVTIPSLNRNTDRLFVTDVQMDKATKTVKITTFSTADGTTCVRYFGTIARIYAVRAK